MNTYCPYHKIDVNLNVRGHYLVDKESPVPVGQRANGPDTQMPPSPVNGGLYGGPQSNKPWASIPVTPTSTNLLYNNLRTANPPPGAIQQAVGTDRLGNNYVAMPEVMWYNPNSEDHHGKYKMKGV